MIPCDVCKHSFPSLDLIFRDSTPALNISTQYKCVASALVPPPSSVAHITKSW